MNKEVIQMFKDRQLKARDIFTIEEISKTEAYNFVKKYHYLGDAKFFCKIGVGLFFGDEHELVGVATYSNPQGIVALKSWFNLDNQTQDVVELSRLAMLPSLNGTNATSFLLGNSIRRILKPKGIRAVITLATSDRHCGSIYQVCNFKYYGLSNKKTDFYKYEGDDTPFKKNPRGATNNWQGCWLPRPQKHRYAYIIDKSLVCNYEEQQYPKKNELNRYSCCNGKKIVYDNRFGKAYTCPLCTGKLNSVDLDGGVYSE